MKTNSDTTLTLYLGLDVHKEQTVIAILDDDRDAEPRHYAAASYGFHRKNAHASPRFRKPRSTGDSHLSRRGRIPERFAPRPPRRSSNGHPPPPDHGKSLTHRRGLKPQER
ncbi:hypothetical protein Hsar01_04086 [Haloferula sargassicola]|uniref:Transposase n=1 Tax=Haloferula sargassicola TaxID=490096 RepID=A0ABP9UVU6_9BACT